MLPRYLLSARTTRSSARQGGTASDTLVKFGLGARWLSNGHPEREPRVRGCDDLGRWFQVLPGVFRSIAIKRPGVKPARYLNQRKKRKIKYPDAN